MEGEETQSRLLTKASFLKFWTVGVMIFVNMLNYMDRYTIAGEQWRDKKGRKTLHILVLYRGFINWNHTHQLFKPLLGIMTELQNSTRNGFNHTIDDTQGGLLQTTFIISFMLLSPIFGYLGDRFTRKYIMAFGIFFWSGFVLAGSFSVVRRRETERERFLHIIF